MEGERVCAAPRALPFGAKLRCRAGTPWQRVVSVGAFSRCKKVRVFRMIGGGFLRLEVLVIN